MPHTHWKGYISFGLVSIPVVLASIENKSKKISLHQFDQRNQARIKYQRINAKTGKEVPWKEVVKGYEDNKENMLVLEKDLNKIARTNTKTIAIESFINQEAVDFVNIQKIYYLLPDKNGEKGYVLLREAISATKKIGIAKLIINKREYLSAVVIYQNALILLLLHYYEEIKMPSELNIPTDDLKKYKVNHEEINIAKQLVQSMTKEWHPEEYKDEYKIAFHKLVKEKSKKPPLATIQARVRPMLTTTTNNFIDLLRKSLESSKPRKLSKEVNKTKRKPSYTKIKPTMPKRISH
jgi:DNA end-binding protein Ku